MAHTIVFEVELLKARESNSDTDSYSNRLMIHSVTVPII